MKILIIPDSFKDSISSTEIITIFSKEFKSLDNEIEIFGCVASDGGEGFLDAVANSVDISEITINTVDPLNRQIKSKYLFQNDSKTAYVELAQASGLELLKIEERNPKLTSTKGTGIIIEDAIRRGAETVFIGLGGSATTDAGLGIVDQLGLQFFDIKGELLEPNGENLIKVQFIKGNYLFPNVKFVVVNDVNNPLFGPNGAAFIYAKQKGANEEDIIELDSGLRHISEIAKENGFKDSAEVAGAGAAGGAAFGLMTFCNAEFISGIEFIFKLSRVEDILKINKVDFIITGEGSLDSQSLQGKLISGVSGLGKRFKVPVIAICGRLALSQNEYKQHGIFYATTIADASVSKHESIKNAEKYLRTIPRKLLPIMKDY
ncbi:glycerate kinase [Flavobacteriaceae bacterium MAR_2010_188]|nr:glycerate kinase [Flavobacteriaceae bacterium MAR_2010_188]